MSFGDSFIGWDYVKAKELITIRKDLFRAIRYNRELLEIGSKILGSPELRDGFIVWELPWESVEIPLEWSREEQKKTSGSFGEVLWCLSYFATLF